MVSFPRSGTQSDKVTLKGAKDCVEAAKKRIQEIIEDLVGAWGARAVLSPAGGRHYPSPAGSRPSACLATFLTVGGNAASEKRLRLPFNGSTGSTRNQRPCLVLLSEGKQMIGGEGQSRATP